jgi:hypothetical protein
MLMKIIIGRLELSGNVQNVTSPSSTISFAPIDIHLIGCQCPPSCHFWRLIMPPVADSA